MELDSLKNIPKTFTTIKIALILSFSLCLLVSVGSMIAAYMISNKHINTTYLLTNDGKAVLINSLRSSDVHQFRKPEIINHIREFHKSFWEVDQFNYEKKVDRALQLIGNSGKDLYLTLKNSGHYSKLVSNNQEHFLQIDSIKVDDSNHPYHGEFYGKVVIKRTDEALETTTKIQARFILKNVWRSEKNPHGLLIENYLVRNN